MLNEQNQQLDSESNIYKFPFDVLNAQDWDIEHIDSYHANALKRDSDKEEWIRTAMDDLKNELSEEEKDEIQQMIETKSYNDATKILREKAEEVDADE